MIRRQTLSPIRLGGLRRLSIDAGFTAFSQVAAMLAIIGLQVLLARSVDLAIFGMIAATQALVVLVEGALVSRGAETALQVMGARWKDGPAVLKAVARHLLIQDVILTGAGFLVFVAVGAAAAHLFGANPWMLAALACTIPLQINFGLRKNLFLLTDRIREQAIWEISVSVLQLALGVLLIPMFGAWGFVATLVGGAIAKNGLAHWMTRRYWAPIASATEAPLPSDVSRTVRISSFHSVLRAMLSNAAVNIDVLILGLTGHPEIVGLYRVARTLAYMPVKVAAPVWVVLRPRLLSAYQADQFGRFCKIVAVAALGFACASVAVLTAGWLAARPLLGLFYGQAFTAAYAPLLILMVGSSVFGAVTGWLTFTMVIAHRKTLGTSIFALQLTLIAIGGLMLADGTAVGMAAVVAGCNLLVSALAWWALLAGRFRHPANGARPTAVGGDAQ